MFMFKNNRNLLIIALIAIVNAIGYGIIIPVIYEYSRKFGLSDFQNGLLFALFSLCQFISTPIIGRLSDKYGRKPMLVASLAGTMISFLMMAEAKSAVVLFLARALDGLTAGNIPVATAVISDTTSLKDRAKGFGVIGAAFGFGFIFGPAISGLTVRYGDNIPFMIAAGISAAAVVITMLFLPETNQHMGQVEKKKLFDFKKMAAAITDKKVGATLAITLFAAMAFTMFTYAFQPFAVKALGMSVEQISLVFTLIGVIGLVTQLFIVPRATSLAKEETTLKWALVSLGITLGLVSLAKNMPMLMAIIAAQAVANSIINPLIQTLLSRETDEKEQGAIFGINASYSSVGTILGPIIGGALGSFTLKLPFIAGGAVMIGASLMTRWLPKRGLKPEEVI